MQEHQVTIGPQTHPLPDPFIVTATMNPLDSEGTYALPLAQMDRFLVKVLVDYPDPEEELRILQRFGGEMPPFPTDVVTVADIRRWRLQSHAVNLEDRLARYIVALVAATRRRSEFVERGASPRATLSIAALARARALCEGRDYALPDDVRDVAPAALRHRLAFTYRTLAERVDTETLIAEIIASVPVP